jgi:hypothetical protein
MSFKQEKILVITRPMKARNLDLYRSPVGRRGLTLNLLDGEPFALDPKTGKTIDVTDLATVKRFTLGVGVDTTGDGWADEYRAIVGDVMNMCDIQGLKAMPARCGTVQISDFLFKCTPSQEDYAVTISIDDSKTRSQFATNRTSDWTYNFRYEDESCDDCSLEENCTKVVCGLVDKINGKDRATSPLHTPRFYNRFNTDGLPVTAVRLFPNSFDFCIGFEENGCEDCTVLSSIGGIEFNDGEPITLDNSTITIGSGEASQDVTLPAQMQGIVDQITYQLGGNGSAALIKVPGKCCQYRIQVNTCFEDFALLDAEGEAIEPCATSNPLAEPIVTEDDCVDCGGDTEVSTTYNCGIRFFFLAPDFPCSPFMPGVNNPPNFYGALGYIRPGSETWKEGSYHIRNVSEMTLPEGLGYYWQQREYDQHVGGEGRSYNPYNVHKGRIGYPDPISKATNAVRTKCHELYCSVHLLHGGVKRENAATDSLVAQKGHSVLLIPQGATDVQNSVLSFINGAAEVSGCTSIVSVSCAESVGGFNAVHDK